MLSFFELIGESMFIIMMVMTGLISVGLGLTFYMIYENKQKKLVNAKISDQDVIQITKSNDGKINVALLCEHSNLTASEAKIKLKYLADTGALSIDWKDMFSGGTSYILKGRKNKIFSGIGQSIQEIKSGKSWKEILPQLAESVFNTNTPKEIPNQSISRDAQIIKVALEHKNVVSASLICVELNISIDEAQKKLEELRQKQIFISEIGDNGGLLYRLLN